MEEVRIELQDAALDGDLRIPSGACGLVVFCHGSGSSRRSPRNRQVASDLNDGALATLLFDLLTPDEQAIDERSAELRFDIGLLTRRVVQVVDWLGRQSRLKDLPIGLFGSSTGAAGALMAAAERPGQVRAVVSRGGRPDLAAARLPHLPPPTLLIVGGHDTAVLEMNRGAAEQLAAPHQIHVVPNATHLFEEPGALEEVAGAARDWFRRHLAAGPPA